MDRSPGGVFSRLFATALASVASLTFGCGNVRPSPANDAGIDAEPAIDASIDAPIDAPLPHKYEVGYVNEFTLAPNNRVLLGFTAVVNVGTQPLNATTDAITVVSFADDHPLVEWEFRKEQGAGAALAPGRAAGLLSPLATERIVTSGLVTEPIDDRFLSLFMTFVTPPPVGLTFNAQAVVRIDGENVTLPFTIHTADVQTITFHSARRVNSAPTPAAP